MSQRNRDPSRCSRRVSFAVTWTVYVCVVSALTACRSVFVWPMVISSALRIVGRHDRVEDPRQEQDDEEVDERHRGRRTEVELAECGLDQVDRQEGRRISGPAAGDDERLRVD